MLLVSARHGKSPRLKSSQGLSPSGHGLQPRSTQHCRHDATGEHDHDDFESFHVDLPEQASPQPLLERLKTAVAAHDILRVKGFLAVSGKEMRLVLQGVGNRLQHYYDRAWVPGEERASRLVVIGLKGLDRSAIAAALTGAA